MIYFSKNYIIFAILKKKIMSYYLNVSSRCLFGLADFFITNVVNPVLEKVQNFSIKIFQKKKDERPNFEGFFDLREVEIDYSDPFKNFFKDLVDISSEESFYDGDEVVVSKYPDFSMKNT